MLMRAQHEKIKKENAQRVQTPKDKNRVRKGGEAEKKKGKDVVSRDGKIDEPNTEKGVKRGVKALKEAPFPMGGKGNHSELMGRVKFPELSNNGSTRSRRSIFSWIV